MNTRFHLRFNDNLKQNVPKWQESALTKETNL